MLTDVPKQHTSLCADPPDHLPPPQRQQFNDLCARLTHLNAEKYKLEYSISRWYLLDSIVQPLRSDLVSVTEEIQQIDAALTKLSDLDGIGPYVDEVFS